MSKKEIDEGIFLKRLPSKHMQKILNECGAKEHIIMGHFVHEQELIDKHKWLDMHFPMIKRRPFVYYTYSKADAIIRLCNGNNINIADVVFVDDVLPIIKEAEKKGIKSYHISSFLDWDYQYV